MSRTKLICTKCGKEFTTEKVLVTCDECSSTLELEMQRGEINSDQALGQSVLERYKEFYTFLEDDRDYTLGEGFTGLVKSNRLANELAIKNVYFKNETQNPTWSFKDRGTITGILHAIALGYKKIGTVSTGNMAVSVAAYGAKAGLETYVLVKKGIAPEKLKPIAMYGPHLIEVDGDYGNLYYESLRIGKENDIYFINSDVPFRIEGYKTLAFEVCEQLNFNAPDYVVVPTSAGGNIRGIEKGFQEFMNSGYIKKVPRIICAQSEGCAPIALAYFNDNEEISRFNNPNTIAHGIGNPFPPSGNQVLRKLREKDGLFATVSNEEILRAQLELAREGLLVQPASAVSLAAVRKLVNDGIIESTSNVVCVLTGSGLKYTAAFNQHDLTSHQCKLANLAELIKQIQ